MTRRFALIEVDRAGFPFGPTRILPDTPVIVFDDGKTAAAQDVVIMWLDGEDHPAAWRAFIDAAREVADHG